MVCIVTVDIGEKHMATIPQVAKELDLSTKMVNDLIARGTITKKDRGQYDLVEARTEYIRHLRKVAAGRVQAGELDLGEERARLAKEQADAKEMENEMLRGELVHIDDVAKEFGKQASAVKTRLLAIPSKAAPLVINCTKPVEAREILEQMIEEALNELVGHNPKTAD
jgi:phage terminase Nu1 subunit (DNA packaging protein)